MKKLFFLSILLLLGSEIFAQSHEEESDLHDCHDEHKNEFGVASTIVFLEEESALGVHIHYVRSLEHSRLGYGLGYERVFDDHGHNAIGFIAAYHPLEGLHVNLIPGLSFEELDFTDAKFTYHVELAYSFDVGNVHIGPVVGYASDFEHFHSSVGLHLGYGF